MKAGDAVTRDDIEKGLGLEYTYVGSFLVYSPIEADLPRIHYSGNEERDALAAYKSAREDGYTDVVLAARG